MDAVISMLFVIFAPISALTALAVAPRGRRLSDIAALILPPIAFFVIGCFRTELRLGLGLILWPIVIVLGLMYVVAIKIVCAHLQPKNSHAYSVALFILSFGAAIVLAITVPPWYE
jgi:hypothetical protein